MSISKRLELIRKSIKVEPLDDGSSVDNSERRIRDVEQSTSNKEALRDQFLNKTLSAQNIIETSSGNQHRPIKHETQQIAGVYNRAEDINARLRGHFKDSFYAHIPENLNEPSIASDRHESPLVRNNNNSIYDFQASSDNVKDVMMNCNPHRDIPYKAQRMGNVIGANLESIKKSMLEESIKRKIPPPPAFSEPKSRKIGMQASSSKENRSIDRGSRREMKDQCVETTTNTGSLQFEITSNELENLSEEKKVILLEFMKVIFSHFQTSFFIINNEFGCRHLTYVTIVM